MIPVEQTLFAEFDEHGDNVQRGNCLSACIASLFELPLDDVPFFAEHDDWHGEYTRWLVDRNLQLGQVRVSVDEDDPTRLTGYPNDGIYWIATVRSPRGKTRCAVCKGEGKASKQWLGAEERYVEYSEPQPCVNCDATGLEPCLHAVVMCGKELVWDPHPQRDLGHLGFVSGEWFIVRDPALLAQRERVAA